MELTILYTLIKKNIWIFKSKLIICNKIIKQFDSEILYYLKKYKYL